MDRSESGLWGLNTIGMASTDARMIVLLHLPCSEVYDIK
jgi:hypothetical protein